jgi:hypothetical protein
VIKMFREGPEAELSFSTAVVWKKIVFVSVLNHFLWNMLFGWLRLKS